MCEERNLLHRGDLRHGDVDARVGAAEQHVRPSWSAHSRNFEAPMSGLFWWSAVSSRDLPAEHLAAEVGDRHLDGFDPAGAHDIRVHAGQVVDVADHDVLGRRRAPPGARCRARASSSRMPMSASFMCRSPWLFVAECVRRRGTRAASPSCPAVPPRRKPSHDAAVLHDVEAVGQRRGEAEVLFDHDDGVALARAASGWCATAPARSPARVPPRSHPAAAASRRCAGSAPAPASAARRPTGACRGWRAAPSGSGNMP